MAQTVHPLDFQLFDFQQLSVIKVSFLLPKVLNLNPTSSCFAKGNRRVYLCRSPGEMSLEDPP